MFKTRTRKEIESLVKLTQVLDNELRGIRNQYHNLRDAFDALCRHFNLEISIERNIPNKIIIKEKNKLKKISYESYLTRYSTYNFS